MEKGQPLISVLMPVYNSEKFLSFAIKSILEQTYKNFEFIIIDDGSTDSSSSIINEFVLRDNRIKFIQNNKNFGISLSLNKGLEISRGIYVARMDADDISIKERFEIQIEAFEKYPNFGIIGSSANYINSNGKNLGYFPVPLSNIEIKWYSLFRSPFIHPSIMMKKEILDKNSMTYRDIFLYTEDYDLWSRLIPLTNAMNLKKPLLHYRVYPQSSNISKKNFQVKNTQLIALNNINKYCHKLELSQSEIIDVINLINNYQSLTNLNNKLIDILKNLIILFNYFLITIDNYYCKNLNYSFSKMVSRKLLRFPLPVGYKTITSELFNINKYWLLDYFLSIPNSLSQRIVHNHIENIS